MSDPIGRSGNEVVDLLGGRPGWRLEPRSTPGATPLWCFVIGGKVEYSVTADSDSIRLYVMESDEEIVFKEADELTTWLRTHRPEALREHASPVPRKSRVAKPFEWT